MLFMKNRADEIRKRYENVVNDRHSKKIQRPNLNFDKEDMFKDKPLSQHGHPLFKSEGFLLRLMLSICLFLVVAILFKNPSAELGSARAYVQKTFETEFQFAMVSNWYEEQFGRPLVLLPTSTPATSGADSKESTNSESVYALPAVGKVTETFQNNGKGILLETGNKSKIDSAQEGFVSFVGEKDNLGKTVIIQHYDGSESWYGMLDSIDDEIKLYSFIENGSSVGTASKSESSDSGVFYFAIKKGDQFIDPLEVVSFE
jgi:stage IV sporulation protein FA